VKKNQKMTFDNQRDLKNISIWRRRNNDKGSTSEKIARMRQPCDRVRQRYQSVSVKGCCQAVRSVCTPTVQQGGKMEAENRSSIFISYAWGDGFENKEWVRQNIMTNLLWEHDVFWDRDSIAFGELIDGAIAKALSKRPLLVFCLCDQDYLNAAHRVGSGLFRELKMLSKIADEPGVRIVPLILEVDCAERLPEPLIDRAYLNLLPLRQLNLNIGMAVLGVAEGLSQAQLQNEIEHQLATFKLRQRTLNYLHRCPLTIWGSGRNHEVTVYPQGATPFPLRPPQWMWESDSWNYMLNDDHPTFCPTLGRWHWERSTSSLEIRPLGTAVISTFFPQLVTEAEQKILNTGGMLLASSFFKSVLVDEGFSFDANDLVNFLISRDEGFEVLERLLEAADSYSQKTAKVGLQTPAKTDESEDIAGSK
jgi:hypothetical protein